MPGPPYFTQLPPLPPGPLPYMTGVQIAGRNNAGPLEIELNTLAMRFTARPTDFDLVGAYMVAGSTNLLSSSTSGATQNNPNNGPAMASFVAGAPDIVYWIKRWTISLALSITSGTFAATVPTYGLYRIHGQGGQQLLSVVSGSPSAVNPIRLSPGNGQKLKSAMRDPTADFIMPISATSNATSPSMLGFMSTVSAGVEVFAPIVEALQGGANLTVIGGVAGSSLLGTPYLLGAPYNLIDTRAGFSPVVLNGTDSLLLASINNLTTTATTTLNLTCQVYWEEYEMRKGGR